MGSWGSNTRCIRIQVQAQFNMRAIVMWTMHDIPTYGIVVGCVVKGY